MNTGLNRPKGKLYYCKKLKWYQWILQKLHIKNYYVPVGTTIETMGWERK